MGSRGLRQVRLEWVESDRLWRQGEKGEAAYEFGLGLHAMQDISAHGNLRAFAHPRAPKCLLCGAAYPDCPHFKYWRVDNAKAATKKYISEWKEGR